MEVNKKLASLHEISKSQFSKILCCAPGSKDLILEPSVIQPLQKICGVQWLK